MFNLSTGKGGATYVWYSNAGGGCKSKQECIAEARTGDVCTSEATCHEYVGKCSWRTMLDLPCIDPDVIGLYKTIGQVCYIIVGLAYAFFLKSARYKFVVLQILLSGMDLLWVSRIPYESGGAWTDQLFVASDDVLGPVFNEIMLMPLAIW